MKNALVLSFWFPPISGIGGIRAYGLAKYLPNYGWNAIILTQTLPGNPDPELQVIQTPYIDVVKKWKEWAGLDSKKTLNEQFKVKTEKDAPSILDRLVALPSEIITYPDVAKGWYDFAIDAAEKIIETEDIGVIFSTSPPATSNLIAKKLSEKHNIPWVADFRDLWTQNHYYSYSPIRSYFDRRLEVKTLCHASAITTVSAPLAQKLAELHQNAQVFTIKNGFDPTLINDGNTVDPQFLIVHTGNLYHGKRDPQVLFDVLKDLLDSGLIEREDLNVGFYGYPPPGSHEKWLEQEIMKSSLEDCVTLHGEVPHTDSIAIQRKAQMLLLLTWNNPEEKGVYTGKLFEYLAARRPILSVGYEDGGVVKELLQETRSGVHPKNKDELRTVILDAYQEYKTEGKVRYTGRDSEIMKYSHIEMAKQFSEIFTSVL